jgi:hypothetical protein
MTATAQTEIVATHAEEPRLAFTGNPNLIPVCLPETVVGYQDVVVEALRPEHEAFDEYAKAYVGQILHRDNIAAGTFVWPPFKLNDLANATDDQLYDKDGNMKPDIVQRAIDAYLVPTVQDKGNHLLVLHGTVNGSPQLIGGGLSFDSVVNEDEGWISKGIVAKASEDGSIEHRGKGFGRVIQEARVMHWMMEHPQLNNLNTGVNINPEYKGRHIDRFAHQITSNVIGDMDVIQRLRTDQPVTLTDVMNNFANSMSLHSGRGYGDSLGYSEGAYEEFLAEIAKQVGPEGFSGFTPDSVVKRKNIMVATAKLLNVPMTSTEHTFLRLGGRMLNAIENSAVVRGAEELNHTRRYLIVREDWEALAVQRYPEVQPYLEQLKAA